MNSQLGSAAAAIHVCSPNRHARALWLALSRLSPEERDAQIALTMAAMRAGRTTWEGLWEATRNGQLVGALWSYRMPGRIAVVWPPQVIDGERIETRDELLQNMIADLRAHNVRMAQAILPGELEDIVTTMSRAGFQRLTDLFLMTAGRESFPTSLPPSSLVFEHARESEFSRLGGLLKATYVGTMDCPGLEKIRDSKDVIDGYLAGGVSRNSHWYFVRHDGRDVGCVLLNAHAEPVFWELIYMGLIPSARGQRWGAQMARHALWLASQSEAQQVVLAVDTQNPPAIKMYTEAGFSTWGSKRAAWIMTL